MSPGPATAVRKATQAGESAREWPSYMASQEISDTIMAFISLAGGECGACDVLLARPGARALSISACCALSCSCTFPLLMSGPSTLWVLQTYLASSRCYVRFHHPVTDLH